MKYVFISKSNWCEPPRLRHQLAKLVLSETSNEVVFFEKPVNLLRFLWFWARGDLIRHDESFPNIVLVRYPFVFHHKLSFFAFSKINEVVKFVFIKMLVERLGVGNAIVVNFNYEYHFLRQIFKGGRIALIINDLHWGTAPPLLAGLMKVSARRTIASSDVVCTVSGPLKAELEAIGAENVKVFYPWSDLPLRQSRTVEGCGDAPELCLLYWGYVSERLDFNYLIELGTFAAQYGVKLSFRFVGPRVFRNFRNFESIRHIHFFEFLDPMSLEEAIREEACTLAMIPYCADNPEDIVTTFPNKLPRLASQRLVTFVSGMPSIVNEGFIFQFTGDREADVKHIVECSKNLSSFDHFFDDFYRRNNLEKRRGEVLELLEEGV